MCALLIGFQHTWPLNYHFAITLNQNDFLFAIQNSLESFAPLNAGGKAISAPTSNFNYPN